MIISYICKYSILSRSPYGADGIVATHMKNLKAWHWFVLFLVIAIPLLMWGRVAQQKTADQYATLSTREVALLCTTDMATKFHIHPELQITIGGVLQRIPAEIGIQPSCMNSIHTHSADGVLHVESPVQKDFTLGDFFAVWHKDFSKDKILDATTSPTTEIVVTVNGNRVDTYENTVLRDKDKIVISYQKK